MMTKRVSTALAAAAWLALGSQAVAQQGGDQSEIVKRVEAALASDIRTEAERERDANRKPAETLEFFGLEPDMRVVELVPGGGWYTKILGQVLEEEGQLYLAIGAGRVASRLGEWGLGDVEVLEDGAEFKPTDQYGVFDVEGFELPVEDVDMVLTFRNLHNMTPEARASVHAEAYEALKSGGVYGVVDHTRRHMEPGTVENWRRMDPVLAIKEIQDAGFEFADFSDLHYRPDDELEYDTGRKSVRGNSDRFTLKFVKP